MDCRSESNHKSATLPSGCSDPLLAPIYNDIAEGSKPKVDVALDLLNKTNLEQDRKSAQYETKIQHRSLLLHPTTNSYDSRITKTELRRQQLKAKKKPRPLSSKEKRQVGINTVRRNTQNYSVYLPLHELWTGYMQEIIKGGGYEAKFLKADYHGARVRVIKSSCPSVLFLRGIVVRETRHTFVICTTAGTFKTIPKKCTIFEFELSLKPSAPINTTEQRPTESIRWEIYGEHFGFRAADRVGKKFKARHTVDF